MPSDAIDALDATSGRQKMDGHVQAHPASKVEPIIGDLDALTIIRDCEHSTQGSVMVPFATEQQLDEIKSRLTATRFTDGETWSITRPSPYGRSQGHPEFRVMVIGECWHDVERRIAHARAMGNYTKPLDPDVQRLVIAARDVRQWIGPLTKQGEDRIWRPASRSVQTIDAALAPFEKD